MSVWLVWVGVFPAVNERPPEVWLPHPTPPHPREQPITQGHSHGGFKADKCIWKHSGDAGNDIKFYYCSVVAASPFSWSTGRQIYLVPDRVHLIDVALYPFFPFFYSWEQSNSNKCKQQSCHVASHFPPVPLLSWAFHKCILFVLFALYSPVFFPFFSFFPIGVSLWKPIVKTWSFLT